MADRRAITSPQNGKQGGSPPGPRGPQVATRERAKAIQRDAELTAETVIEQIARGALYDPGAFVYHEAGEELYDSDGPEVVDTVTGEKSLAWKKGDVKRSWDVGDYKPLNELTEAQRQAIEGFEIVMKNATAGDGKIDRVLRYKLAKRDKYVEMAAKYHSLLTEKVDVSVTEVGNRLERARQVAMERNQKGKDKR